MSIVGPAGALTQLGLLTAFNMRPVARTIKTRPINNNGKVALRNVYEGWEGHLTYDRQNGNIDALHGILEQNYYAGNPDIEFQVSETVRNPDGSVNQFTYLGVHVHVEDPGQFSQDNAVQVRMAVSCVERIGA
jgi:hypothetical protein